jgi:hypothetical protein
MEFLMFEAILCAALIGFGLGQAYELTKDVKRLLKKHEKK